MNRGLDSKIKQMVKGALKGFDNDIKVGDLVRHWDVHQPWLGIVLDTSNGNEHTTLCLLYMGSEGYTSRMYCVPRNGLGSSWCRLKCDPEDPKRKIRPDLKY